MPDMVIMIMIILGNVLLEPLLCGYRSYTFD